MSFAFEPHAFSACLLSSVHVLARLCFALPCLASPRLALAPVLLGRIERPHITAQRNMFERRQQLLADSARRQRKQIHRHRHANKQQQRAQRRAG